MFFRKKKKQAVVMFAWELGQGFGHIARMLPYAKKLSGQGYEIVWVVLNTQTAHTILKREMANLYKPDNVIPLPSGRRDPQYQTQTTFSFSLVLKNCGFESKANIDQRLQAWQQLFSQHKPVMLVCDHSPTALIAGRMAGIPTVHLADGFSSPLGDSPFGLMLMTSGWQKLPEDKKAQCLQTDEDVLQAINQSLLTSSVSPYQSLRDIFDKADKEYLLTFPEFDHQRVQRDASYYGIDTVVKKVGHKARPDKNVGHILMYIKPFPALPALLKDLKKHKLNFSVHVSEPGIPAQLKQAAEADNVRFLEGKLDWSSIGEQYDMLVNHGNHTSSVEAVMSGLPLVCIPTDPEKSMVAEKISTNHLGIIANPQDANHIFRAIQYLHSNREFYDAVDSLCAKYENHDYPAQIEKICADMLGLV